MKNFISFLLVFLVVNQAPFPAQAQVLATVQVKQIHQCYDNLFEKLKVSYQKMANEPLEINEAMKLRYLKAMIPPKEQKEYTLMDKAKIWGTSALVLYAVEEFVRKKIQKVSSSITDRPQAIAWVSSRQATVDWLEQKGAVLEQLKSSTPPEEIQELMQDEAKVKRLRVEFEQTMKHVQKMDADLASYEARSLGATKWLKFSWEAGFVVIGAVALTSFVMTEIITTGNEHPEFPPSLQPIHDSSSILEYDEQLSSIHPEVAQFRKKLLDSCQATMKQDLDLWLREWKRATKEEILFALGQGEALKKN